jgi:hypothetical protein
VITSYLFLDTATKYTGYAVFEKSVVDTSSAMLMKYGLLKGGSGDVDCRVTALSCKFQDLLRDVGSVACVQEFPSYQSGNRGFDAVKSGDTLQLARLCGHFEAQWLNVIITIKQTYPKIKVPLMYNVTYNQWNGQLPKQVTCERCGLHFGLFVKDHKSIENNWADAVMMGKWFIETKLKLTVTKGDGASPPDRKDY